VLLHRPVRVTGDCGLPSLPAIPVVDVAAGAILLDAVAFLDLAFELVALAGDAVEVIVGELAPLFLDLALDLLPVSFDAVPSMCGLLRFAKEPTAVKPECSCFSRHVENRKSGGTIRRR
jgi:hypothetical protein